MAPLNPISCIHDDNCLTGPKLPKTGLRNLVLAAVKIDYVVNAPCPNVLT